MAENVGPAITRDTELERKMLEAVVADRNAQPRTLQAQVGPSSLGFCRELLRASLFEPESLSEPETHWATAAHVGQTMGAELERIFGERLGALEQQRITAVLTDLGLELSGSSDLLFMDQLQITDLKSTDDMGGVLYDLGKNAQLIESLLEIWHADELYERHIDVPDGSYELTDVLVSKISKLHYYTQLAVYVVGAVQAGILPPTAEARLVFYDRSGAYQEFVALVITSEELAMFFDIAQARVAQVAKAQDAYEKTGGNPATIAHLRDQSPSFCFSPKVMCARRMHCWAGSQWAPEDELRGAEVASAVDRYVEGRRLAKLGEGMKKSARGDLKGVEGVLPDGRMVSWVRGGTTINVVETTKAETPRVEAADGRVLDDKPAEVAGTLVVPNEMADDYQAGNQSDPGYTPFADNAFGEVAPYSDRQPDWPDEPPAWLDEHGPVDHHQVQMLDGTVTTYPAGPSGPDAAPGPDGPTTGPAVTPAAQVLAKNSEDLTDAQRAYLERHISDGEALVLAAEQEGVRIPKGVGITEDGEIVDERPEDKIGQRLKTLRALQERVAAERKARHGGHKHGGKVM